MKVEQASIVEVRFTESRAIGTLVEISVLSPFELIARKV